MEIVRDSCLIYEQLAEEQLIQGQVAELLHQRELSVAMHNGLKMCPDCKSIHCNLDSVYCSLCNPEFVYI